jgi:hypothetical protein
MSKYLLPILLTVTWLAACGRSATPANDPSTGTDDPSADAPSSAEPACDGRDETTCKITAGCAWSNESTCVVDTAMGM